MKMHFATFALIALVPFYGLDVQAKKGSIHATDEPPLDLAPNFLRARSQSRNAGGPKLDASWGGDNRTKPGGGEKYHVDSNLKCGVTHKAVADTEKYASCPADCPFFAQNRRDAEHCTFLCVPGAQCSQWNENKPIPDFIKGSSVCRGPVVQFCQDLTMDGKDTCAKCQYGWTVWEGDGQCYFTYWKTIYSLGIVAMVFAVVALVYLIEWACRPTTNMEAITKALEHRSQSKLLIPKHKLAEGEQRRPYDTNTNLCTTDIGGPGMVLHFNTQAFLIGWPLCVALLWTLLACFHWELFYIGMRKFGTPRHNCILVAWGYETQQRLMWTKVLFLALVYVGSFISFLIFAIRQYRIYEALDAKEKTMGDYVAELKGLPVFEGSEEAEDIVTNALRREQGFGSAVVGVSICWVFQEKQEAIMKCIREEQVAREIELGYYAPAPDSDRTAGCGPIRKQLYEAERYMVGPDESGETNDEERRRQIEEMLTCLKSSQTAFVVFATENDRDNAVENSRRVTLTHNSDDYPLQFTKPSCEPATVNWHNFGSDSSIKGMLYRFMRGFCFVYLPALAVWFCFFYVPYAWSLYNFNYANGAELPGYYGLVFTMIVVGGNATMYFVCDACCDIIGFKYTDTKQVTYMLMYLTACMINVVLDLGITYIVALKAMRGLDFRTYHGRRLEDITTFTEQFETYAMQRELAEAVYSYAFPGTFLVPFILEPIITVLVPYYAGRMIVRTHREIQGACAEAYLAAFEFDLGRYADILLNVFLGILIFWFPGGYTWSLFFGMTLSHVVIYSYDHWKIINVIPSIKIVSKGVDDCAQYVLAGCCGLILSALVFKANCQGYAGYCVQGWDLINLTTFAGLAHFAIHSLLLMFLVPKFGRNPPHEHEEFTYAECATVEARSWFSVNPVHCLRSKYIYKHEPPCIFSAVGKEHLLEVNESIGCHFKDCKAFCEEFSVSHEFRELKAVGHSLGIDKLKKLCTSSSKTLDANSSSKTLDAKEEEETTESGKAASS